MTVHQVNVGGAGDIGNVGRTHVHASPTQAIRYRGAQTSTSHVLDKRAGCTLVEVVIIALFLEVAVERLGVCIRPVAQQDDVIAIVRDGIFVLRLNYETADQAYLLLKAAVTVIPIGPVLRNRKPLNKWFAWCDSCKTQPGYAIHRRRNTNTVPVDVSTG